MLAYVVRHAESLANAGATADLNSGLSDLGRAQAAALADRLAPAEIRAIYASPYRRSLETALILARRIGIAVRLRPELCEYHHAASGPLPNVTLPAADAIVRACPGVEVDPDGPRDCRWPPLDETPEHLWARAIAFAEHLIARWREERETVAVIGHGSPCARLIDAWLTGRAGPSFRFIIDNAAVSALRHVKGVSSLICLNEASHLRGLPPPQISNFDGQWLVKPLPPTSYW